MQIQYQNTRADFKAFYEDQWRSQKGSSRKEYYEKVLWYLSVLGLAIYIAIKNDEVFAVCVFGVLAVIYIRQNWSFARYWEAQVDSYADSVPEALSTISIDEDGITECFSNSELRVKWSEIHAYTTDEERLFVHFLKYRAFIIPLSHLSSGQREELIATLERHNVRKRP